MTKECKDCRHFIKRGKKELCGHPNVYVLRARYSNGPLPVALMREDKQTLCRPSGDWWELKQGGGPSLGKAWMWIGIALVVAVLANVVLQHVRGK